LEGSDFMTIKTLSLAEMLKMQTNINFKRNSLFSEADYGKTQKKLLLKSHKTLKKYEKE
jgi:hypothetical protein